MKIEITLKAITVKDENSGKEFTVRTLRSAKEIAEYIKETEKDEMVSKLETAVIEAFKSHRLDVLERSETPRGSCERPGGESHPPPIALF